MTVTRVEIIKFKSCTYACTCRNSSQEKLGKMHLTEGPPAAIERKPV